MFAEGQNGTLAPIARRSPHDTSQAAKSLAGMRDLALDLDGGADGCGPQVGDVERTAHARVLPEAGA